MKLYEAQDDEGNTYPIPSGRLYCQLHNVWLDPPDAAHRDHPEFDPINSGEDCCTAVDVDHVLRFLEFKKVRWCETHGCQHMLKDACSWRMVALGRRGDGAVNLGEQMDGPKDCVEGWRWMIDEDPEHWKLERIKQIDKALADNQSERIKWSGYDDDEAPDVQG